MIKISKEEKGKMVEYQYNSINKACQENGATSGMNRQAGLRYLENAGFDIGTLVETKRTKRKTKTIIEKIMKLCAVVDKEKIKKLETERTEIVKNAKTASELEKVVKLNEEIKKLNNPTVTDNDIIEKTKVLLKEYREMEKEKTENETETK